jgi:hypothetical protein
MNERDREQKLDELISRTINTTRPEFDPEEWKRQYPDEFRALVSRSAQREQRLWKRVFASPITKFAAVAVIIVAIGLCIVERNSREQERPRIANRAKSPVEMMTEISLIGAYRKGGMEAVEKQCEQAFKKAGLRPGNLSVEQMLAELNPNGKSRERTRL